MNDRIESRIIAAANIATTKSGRESFEALRTRPYSRAELDAWTPSATGLEWGEIDLQVEGDPSTAQMLQALEPRALTEGDDFGSIANPESRLYYILGCMAGRAEVVAARYAALVMETKNDAALVMETQNDITLAGIALYGDRWQSEIARDLGVSDRSVRRWATGEQLPTADNLRRIGGLLATRANTCAGLAQHFEAEYGTPLFPPKKTRIDKMEEKKYETMVDVARDINAWINELRNYKGPMDNEKAHLIMVKIWEKIPDEARKDARFPGWRDDPTGGAPQAITPTRLDGESPELRLPPENED